MIRLHAADYDPAPLRAEDVGSRICTAAPSRSTLPRKSAGSGTQLDSLHSKIVALERENADLAERLEARKIIDRAKGRLMDEHGLSEADSWRFLQKSAMNSRRKIHEVAHDVVGGVLTP